MDSCASFRPFCALFSAQGGCWKAFFKYAASLFLCQGESRGDGGGGCFQCRVTRITTRPNVMNLHGDTLRRSRFPLAPNKLFFSCSLPFCVRLPFQSKSINSSLTWSYSPWLKKKKWFQIALQQRHGVSCEKRPRCNFKKMMKSDLLLSRSQKITRLARLAISLSLSLSLCSLCQMSSNTAV